VPVELEVSVCALATVPQRVAAHMSALIALLPLLFGFIIKVSKYSLAANTTNRGEGLLEGFSRLLQAGRFDRGSCCSGFIVKFARTLEVSLFIRSKVYCQLNYMHIVIQTIKL
jgi:hypothetical protein